MIQVIPLPVIPPNNWKQGLEEIFVHPCPLELCNEEIISNHCQYVFGTVVRKKPKASKEESKLTVLARCGIQSIKVESSKNEVL